MADLAIQITDDLIEAIASRVAAILASAQQDSGPDQWLDAARAAEYLACPKSRIYDLIQLGKLEAHRDGRRVLFRRSELDRYIESGAQAPRRRRRAS